LKIYLTIELIAAIGIVIAYLLSSSYLNKRPHLKKWRVAIGILYGLSILMCQFSGFRDYQFSALDHSGNTYVVFRKNFPFSKNGKIEMAKFDTSGSLQWIKEHDFMSLLSGPMITDEHGNIYMALMLYNDISKEDILSQSQDIVTDNIVVKFDSQGNLLWKNKTRLNIELMHINGDKLTVVGFTDYGILAAEDINISRGLLMRSQSYPDWPEGLVDLLCTDNSGNIFTFSQNRSILNKMTFEGNHLWDQKIDDTVRIVDLAVDEQNHVYLGGSFKKPDHSMAYIAKLTSEGQTIWSKAIIFDDKTDKLNLVNEMAIDQDGHLYAFGEHESHTESSDRRRGWRYSKLFLVTLLSDGQTERQILTDLNWSFNSDFLLHKSGNFIHVTDSFWSDSTILIKYDCSGQRQCMAVSLSVDRVNSLLMLIVGLLDAIIKWRTKNRKTTRVNPYTGASEKCYDEYRID